MERKKTKSAVAKCDGVAASVCETPVSQTGTRSTTRGLPDDEALFDVAMMYLNVQAKLWPTAVNEGVILKANKAAAQALAEEYKGRFRESCEPNWRKLTMPKEALELGAAYLRYSCESSNPRSLAQQLRNCLERAAREGIFIPWEVVFADAALSGTTSARPGYQAAKKAVGRKESPVKVLIIDELGRAARDAVESLKLGRLIDSCGKRMIGVTDGFDTNQPQYKMMLHLYAMNNELFVEQLRHKVSRGMRDAFERHEVTHSPRFGYSLKILKDKKGNPVVKPNGKIKKRVEINKMEAKVVRKIYDLYTVKKMSPEAIAKHLNDGVAAGKKTWSQVQVSRILKHPLYVGIEYRGVRQRFTDPETGRVTTTIRPEKEWLRREMPHLRIISDEVRANALNRAAELSCAFGKQSPTSSFGRASAYAKTLVRPVCGYCGKELSLGNSGKHSSFCCLNGKQKKRGCRLTGYKSVAMIERCVVSHLMATIDAGFSRKLVKRANEALRREAARPKMDVAPMKRRLRELQTKLANLVSQLELSGSAAVAKKIASHETDIAELKQQVASAESRNGRTPKLLKLKEINALLEDVQSLMLEDIAISAPVIREITGPVVVTLSDDEKPHWIASFTLNGLALAIELGRKKKSPTAEQLEYLLSSGWRFDIEAKIPVAKATAWEMHWDKIVELNAAGHSVLTIAAACKVTHPVVLKVLKKHAEGFQPEASRKLLIRQLGDAEVRPTKKYKYMQYSAEVARLRDSEQLTFAKIREKMRKLHDVDLDLPTLTRAYHYAHPEIIEETISTGKRPKRGRFYASPEGHRRLELVIRSYRWENDRVIAEMAGCTTAAVYRKRKELGMLKRDLRQRLYSGEASSA